MMFGIFNENFRYLLYKIIDNKREDMSRSNDLEEIRKAYNIQISKYLEHKGKVFISIYDYDKKTNIMEYESNN